MKIRILAAALAAALVASPAIAQTPVKAPPFAYPSASGWYALISTEGGGGTVSVAAPNVNSNSLVSNQISAYAGGGYVWGRANSPAWTATELKIGITNFNGAAPGLSWQGPVSFHGRLMFGAPVDQLAAFFPNIFQGLAPPFQNLPSGFQAKSVSWYISPVGFYARDDSITFNNRTTRAWGFSYAATPIGALVQLTNGGAADFHTDVSFNQHGLCSAMALGQACARPNVEVLAGVDYKWGIGAGLPALPKLW